MAFSISEPVAQRLKGMAAEYANGNVSLLVELALTWLFRLPPEELKQIAWRYRHDRAAASREDWMSTFWVALGEIMEQPDGIGNPYASRTFKGFYVALLLNHPGRYDDEDDPFIAYIGPMPILPESPSPVQREFERSSSPAQAAEWVAEQLRKFGVRIADVDTAGAKERAR